VVRVISWQPASGHALPQLRRRLGGWQPALPGGTGPGLALVRSIAPGHGGEVLVRSAPGKGSMFELMLPAMTAAGEGPASIHAHAGAAESCRTWLPR
jgi:signal transduction histidine kinase